MDRFWAKVERTSDGCWTWTASLVAGPRGGYGQFRVGRKMRKAHVVAYERAVGLVPEGLVLDHLCRNRACVNPDHLEPVTPRVNSQRSPHLSAKTTCVHGHDLSDAYVYDGRRSCRTCKNARKREARSVAS